VTRMHRDKKWSGLTKQGEGGQLTLAHKSSKGWSFLAQCSQKRKKGRYKSRKGGGSPGGGGEKQVPEKTLAWVNKEKNSVRFSGGFSSEREIGN